MLEVVLVGGMPAGGKTTVTKRYEAQGYTRLNRDLVGGKVDDLIPVFITIKYKDEDWVFLLWFAMLFLAGGTAWCFQEAVKKAENEQRIPVDVQPGQR
jgi:hypothetical protein